MTIQTLICAVEGCVRPVHCKKTGFCNAHHQRFRRLGEPGPAEVQPMARHGASAKRICKVHDCGQRAPYASEHLCIGHYRRLKRYGDPEGQRQFPSGPRHWSWREDAGYSAAHSRVIAERGRASEHTCAHCGREAKDWAYDHTDPEPRYWRGHPFSLNTIRYKPLCRSCHRRFDRDST